MKCYVNCHHVIVTFLWKFFVIYLTVFLFCVGFENKWKCSSRIISVSWNCWWAGSLLMGWRDQQDVKVTGSINVTSYISKPSSWVKQNWNRKTKNLDYKEIAYWSSKDRRIKEDEPFIDFLIFVGFRWCVVCTWVSHICCITTASGKHC